MDDYQFAEAEVFEELNQILKREQKQFEELKTTIAKYFKCPFDKKKNKYRCPDCSVKPLCKHKNTIFDATCTDASKPDYFLHIASTHFNSCPICGSVNTQRNHYVTNKEYLHCILIIQEIGNAIRHV